MKPRQFWTRVFIQQVNGTEETWFVNTSAVRDQYGTYTIETTIDCYREKSVEEMAASPGLNQKMYRRERFHCVAFKDEAAFAGRNWQVQQAESKYVGLGHITRHDGFDFGTLAAAVWMFMEKCIEALLTWSVQNRMLVWCNVNPRVTVCEYEARRRGGPETRYQLISYAEAAQA